MDSFITVCVLSVSCFVLVAGQGADYDRRPGRPRPPILPPKPCGPVCRIFCPFGNVLDSRGCPTCSCKPNPNQQMCPGNTPSLGSCNPNRPGTRCGLGAVCRPTFGGRGICCRAPLQIVCPAGSLPTGQSCSPFFPDSNECGLGAFCQGGPADGGICCRRGITPPIGPGVCPPSDGRAGICVFRPGINCVSDSECRRGQKCCQQGCGRVCINVILPKPLPELPNPVY